MKKENVISACFETKKNVITHCRPCVHKSYDLTLTPFQIYIVSKHLCLIIWKKKPRRGCRDTSRERMKPQGISVPGVTLTLNCGVLIAQNTHHLNILKNFDK